MLCPESSAAHASQAYVPVETTCHSSPAKPTQFLQLGFPPRCSHLECPNYIGPRLPHAAFDCVPHQRGSKNQRPCCNTLLSLNYYFYPSAQQSSAYGSALHLPELRHPGLVAVLLPADLLGEVFAAAVASVAATAALCRIFASITSLSPFL